MTPENEQRYLNWIKNRLVCRTDFYAPYFTDAEIAKHPFNPGDRRLRCRANPVRNLTDDALLRAVRGQQAVALHPTDPTKRQCKYLMIDIDDRDGSNAEANEQWMFELYARAEKYKPLLERSSAGSYHLWIFFSDWADSATVYEIGVQLCEGKLLEIFPRPFNGRLGNIACRMPGVHPCRNCMSAIWSGRWVDYGDEFVDLICSYQGIAPPVAPPRSRGLGDTIAKGIHAATFGLIKPCGGCKRRQEKLNRLVAYAEAT